MEKIRDSLIIFTIFTLLVIVVLCLHLKQVGIDKEGQAFRTMSELETEPLYLDNEAIALAGSSDDAGLREKALEASNLINDIREENNLESLDWDINLETVADVRANEISDVFSHTRPNGQPWSTVNSKIQGGENLAFGYDTPKEVVQAWMDSESHKENILYPDFEKCAIAIYENDDVLYWTEQFSY